MDNGETFVGLDYDLNEIRIGAKVAVLEQLTIGTVIGPGEGDSVIVEWGSGQRADIMKDTLAVILPLDSDHPEVKAADNLRISLNADTNAKNSIQFEYNGEIAFDLVIENDPANENDNVSARATIRTWPIEGGGGEEASVLLRHRGPEPTGS